MTPSQMKAGRHYIIQSGLTDGRLCRKFVRWAKNGDDVIMADSNDTESQWDQACVIRELTEEEVAGWPNIHRQNTVPADPLETIKRIDAMFSSLKVSHDDWEALKKHLAAQAAEIRRLITILGQVNSINDDPACFNIRIDKLVQEFPSIVPDDLGLTGTPSAKGGSDNV